MDSDCCGISREGQYRLRQDPMSGLNPWLLCMVIGFAVARCTMEHEHCGFAV